MSAVRMTQGRLVGGAREMADHGLEERPDRLLQHVFAVILPASSGLALVVERKSTFA